MSYGEVNCSGYTAPLYHVRIKSIPVLRVYLIISANGSGCRNRHIEETELLPGIADELNVDVETLSAETVACVERITVEGIGVTVVLREKQESA